MEPTNARDELAKAEQLASTSSNTAARWYVRYLVIYGVASFVLAASFAVIPDSRLATLVTMPFWLVIVVGLSVWAARQRTAVRGFGWLHGTVIGVWAAVWAATIGLGTTVFVGVWQWFVACGVVLAGIAFTGAYVTHRRSRA